MCPRKFCWRILMKWMLILIALCYFHYLYFTNYQAKKYKSSSLQSKMLYAEKNACREEKRLKFPQENQHITKTDFSQSRIVHYSILLSDGYFISSLSEWFFFILFKLQQSHLTFTYIMIFEKLEFPSPPYFKVAKIYLLLRVHF